MSLDLALVIRGDAAGAKTAAGETTAAVRTIGVEAARSSDALTAANDQAAASAKRVTDMLTGQEAVQTVLGRTSAATATGLNSVGGAAKLTSGQLLNLSRQGNDVVTMFALGAPAMQIFASQAGQVFDVLQSGPAGALGSLKAIGAGIVSFISTPLGAVTTVTAIAAAGIAAYATLGKDKIRDVDAILKDHEAAIKRVQSVWGDAYQARLKYGQASSSQAIFGFDMSASELRSRLRKDVPTVTDAISNATSANLSDIGGARAFRGTALFTLLSGEIEDLRKKAKDGLTPDIIGLTRRIEELGQASGNKGIRALADDAANAIRPIEDLARKLLEADIRLKALFNDIGPNGMLLSRGTTNLADMGNLAAFEAQQTIARQRVQQSFDADILGINARSPQERAAAARAAATATYNSDETPEARAQRIELAGKKALIEAEHQLSTAQEQRRRSLDQTLGSAQLDLALIGKTTAEAEGLRMAFQLEQQVREEAARNNVAVDEAEIRRIKEKAAEYSRYADQIARATLTRDLRFERDQLGRSPIEATVADRLKSAGLAVDLNSEEAAAIRMNEVLKAQKQIWEDIRNSGVDAIGKIVDSATNGFSDIEEVGKSLAGDLLKQFTELAIKNPMANAIYGKNLPTLDGIGGIGGFVKTLLGGGMPEAIGGQSVGTADITAGVVNVNGALGLGGQAGTGGALGAITRLLTGANDNSATGTGAASPTSAGGVGAQIWNFFAGKGLQGHQIAGIIGNLTAESWLNPNAVNPKGGAAGLPQWLGSRLSGLLSANGGKVPGVGGQLDYIWKELQGSESGVLKQLLSSKDVRSATAAFGGFERGEGWSKANPENIVLWQKRLSASQEALAKFQGTAGAATKDLGTFGGGLGQLGNALSKFPAAPAGGGGGLMSWLGGLFGGGGNPSLSPAAWSAIQAGGGGLYDVGGPTGGSDPRRVAGLVHEKEYVMDEPVVRALGVPFLDNLRRAAKSGRGYAEGGYAMPGYRNSSSAGNWSSQQNQPTKIERHYHDYAGVSIREEESDDGQGGRREDIIIEEKLTAAANRPGSSFNKTLNGRGARQPVKRR